MPPQLPEWFPGERGRRAHAAAWAPMQLAAGGERSPCHDAAAVALVQALGAAGFAVNGPEAMHLDALDSLSLEGTVAGTPLCWAVWSHGANLWTESGATPVDDRFEVWDYETPEALFAALARTAVERATALARVP